MLHGINMLRTLACVAIAIFHMTEFVNANSETVRLSFDIAGPGFHLFLQISGVILILVTRPDDTPQAFFTKRAVRIIPIYWLMTLVAIAVVLYRPWLLHDAVLSTESILSSFLFLPHVDAGGSLHPILYVGWTLNYMMLFYALFALSLFLPEKYQRNATVGGLLLIMFGAQFLPGGAFCAFYSDPILLEFAAGCLLGQFLRRPAVIAWIKRTPMWPIAIAGILGLWFAMEAGHTGYANVAVYAPATALLVFAVAGQDLYRAPMRLGILNEGGKVSYGVYLIHPIIIPFAGVFIFDKIDTGWLGTSLLFLTVMPMTLALAWLSFNYVEVPSNAWLRRVLRVDTRKREDVSTASAAPAAHG